MDLVAASKKSPRYRPTDHFIGANHAILHARNLAACHNGAFAGQTMLADSKRRFSSGDGGLVAIGKPTSLTAYRAGGWFKCAAQQEFSIWAVLCLAALCPYPRVLVLPTPKAVSIWNARWPRLRIEVLSDTLSWIFFA
jgi:hypothetical protein